MTSLLFGAVGNYQTPPDENIVRMTTAPVTPDAGPAMAEAAPEPQEVETDSNPLLGMEQRQLASHWHPSEKAAPEWADRASTQHDAAVNERQAKVGTAAQREVSGEFGHGTLAFAEGIEPVSSLIDGGRMGNEYFAIEREPIQSGTTDYMSLPPGSDTDTRARVSAEGRIAAREATVAAYRDMWRGVQNGS